MDEKELELPEIRFDDDPPPAEGAPEAQAAPQPVQAPQAQSEFGPYTAQVRAQYEATQKAYQELVQRKKQLQESGYSVPPEIDAEITKLAAKLVFTEQSLQEAKRRDALAAIPYIVSKLVGELSPEVAKRVEPELRRSLEQAVAANPDLIRNDLALQMALRATLGELAMRRAMKTGTQPTSPGISAPSAPPAQQKAPLEIPEEARRLGVSESAWQKVAHLKEDDIVAPIDLF